MPSLPPLVHGTHHDLESFIWVAVYSILLHEFLKSDEISTPVDSGEEPQIFGEFHLLFGMANYGDVAGAKTWLPLHKLDQMVPSQPLRTLIKDLRSLSYKQNRFEGTHIHPPELITYHSILAAFAKAEEALEGEIESNIMV
jgi:hypothetical protein